MRVFPRKNGNPAFQRGKKNLEPFNANWRSNMVAEILFEIQTACEQGTDSHSQLFLIKHKFRDHWPIGESPSHFNF
jgi:hypothetical protein